jgi:hypothetical protein
MSTISGVGKVAYVYDQPTDTWHPVAGYANTTETYSWSGPHTFTNTVSFNSVLNAKAGINNFFNESARNVAIPSPAEGTVVFVRQTDTGSVINQIQYYSGGNWRVYGDNANLLEKTESYTLALSDAGKTFQINSSSSVVIEVPAESSVGFANGAQIAFIRTGTGRVEFTSPIGINILSKNSNKSISSQYSPATLIKRDATNWILIGDLTA